MSSRFAALFAVLGALLLMPLTTGAAWAQKRGALVIGNGAYQTVAKLPNPLKDASAIAEMFKKAGFDWVKDRISDLGGVLGSLAEAAAGALGMPLSAILAAVPTLHSAAGRMQSVVI